MTHKRLRVANMLNSFHANAYDFGLSKAVVAQDQVVLVGCTGLTLDGRGFIGEGDPAAQAERAMENVRTMLEEAGGRLDDICLINNYTTRHSDRALVYPVIARHLHHVHPVSTGVIVKALARPYIDFEIDAWAVIPKDRAAGHDRFRLTNAKGGYLLPTLDYSNARVIRANDHIFLQGQTGMSLDGRDFDGVGDPARQVEVAMQNVRTLLADAGATMQDICKITTYLTDSSHRPQIESTLATHLQGVNPTMTSSTVKGLARSELDFEIDVFAILPTQNYPHQRVHTKMDTSGEVVPQSQVVRTGRFVYVQGQSGLRLDGCGVTGVGDPAAQADQAMENVKVLLAEVGATMMDICKITTYVTDPAHRDSAYLVFGRYLSGVNPTSTGGDGGREVEGVDRRA